MRHAQMLLTAAERDALTLAILVGDVGASDADAAAITQWAIDVRWQARCLQAALDGRCGLRNGPEGVDLSGLTSQEILDGPAHAEAADEEETMHASDARVAPADETPTACACCHQRATVRTTTQECACCVCEQCALDAMENYRCGVCGAPLRVD
jgi:hypothetical protein